AVFPSSLTGSFCMASPTTEIYPLSLHDALPISFIERDRLGIVKILEEILNTVPQSAQQHRRVHFAPTINTNVDDILVIELEIERSEEHTSELQSRENLVCRLLLEKKKINSNTGD